MSTRGTFFQRVERTIQIDGDNTITVRAPTYGEAQEANSKAMVVGFDMAGTADIKFDSNKLESEFMHICIIGWSGPGFGDTPVSNDAIDSLPVWVLTKVRGVVNDLTRLTADAEKKQ